MTREKLETLQRVHLESVNQRMIGGKDWINFFNNPENNEGLIKLIALTPDTTRLDDCLKFSWLSKSEKTLAELLRKLQRLYLHATMKQGTEG